jgi:hypothetical protein
MLEREQAMEVLTALRDELRVIQSDQSPTAYRLKAGDQAALDLAVTLVCDQHGVDPAEYRTTLEADPSLLHLQDAMIREVIADPADPGPYDAISRESPAGTEENWHVRPFTPEGTHR